MNEQLQHIRTLFEKMIQGTITASEKEELSELVETRDNEDILTVLDAIAFDTPPDNGFSEENWEPVVQSILEYGNEKSPAPVRKMWYRAGWVKYAAVLIVLGISAVLLIKNVHVKERDKVAKVQEDVLPGKEGATLTQADGTIIRLDSLGNGFVAIHGGGQANLSNGRLVYNTDERGSAAVSLNTITTPYGRQFQVVLPDGTAVWLNSGSSVRFPTAFTGKDREVTVTGEAYFEVAKNAAMPFLVNVDDRATINVLGTHFNVNAYNNEQGVTATLLEGRVKVAGKEPGHTTGILQPMQQATVMAVQGSAEELTVKNVDETTIHKVIAWKNGLFDFAGASLPEVMRQLERWYDIQVVYEHGIPKVELEGEMTKGVTLNGLLNVLRELGVHCKLEGRKLIVQ